MAELARLNDHEVLTLAALARVLVRLDGRFTVDEARALAAPPSETDGAT